QILLWSSRRTAAALALAGHDAALAATEGRPVALAELRKRLAPDELLLDFIVLDSNVAVVAVASDTARLVRLPITTGSLGSAINGLRRPLITTFGGRIDLARARFDLAAAASLYDALLRPLAALTRGRRRLIVVPDGPLHALAFDALVMAAPPHGGATPDYRAPTYVLDSLEIEYLPSPAFLRPEAERARLQRLGAQRLLAVGYGAPGSTAEIQAVRDIWPRERLTTLEGGAATERGVKARMAQFGILHFAVHAAADARDPLVAHLRLSADSLSDGYLHANEIATTRISADLVVLSACETNVGPIYSGEGVMGIARAFLAGGARSVVATQWPVGAETAELMREFYARLSHGESPASALRGAKLRFRRSPEFAHPFHWAGFVLIR
ncbi:MAG: CHAT domain-containing protein, partial [Gemmatimonadales bacterium]